jgi:hypothetical protein
MEADPSLCVWWMMDGVGWGADGFTMHGDAKDANEEF